MLWNYLEDLKVICNNELSLLVGLPVIWITLCSWSYWLKNGRL